MARNPKSAKQSSKPALPGPMTAEAVQDTFMLLKKALIERALGAELGQSGLSSRTGPARSVQQPTQRHEQQDGTDR